MLCYLIFCVICDERKLQSNKSKSMGNRGLIQERSYKLVILRYSQAWHIAVNLLIIIYTLAYNIAATLVIYIGLMSVQLQLNQR